MGKLYWVQSRDGEENLSLGCGIYRRIFAEKENVIFLSARETRDTHRDSFDAEDTEEAWKKSANRDMRMICYLTEQDIDVVYCSFCEFQETREWVASSIKEVELVSEDEGDSLPEDMGIPQRAVGTLYWITGLSGAGKTTIGRMLCEKIRRSRKNVLLVDGDMFRDAMDPKRDYSRSAREDLCRRNGPFLKMLSDKGFHIVCCTIAMFEGIRAWNRKNFVHYMEIYLEVPMEVLEERRKELYAGAREGRVKDVVGVNQVAEYPRNPDIRICNDGTVSPEKLAEEIWRRIHPWRPVLDEAELPAMADRLRERIEFSLYAYIDIMKYGLRNKDMQVYRMEDSNGVGTVLAMRYHNGLNLVKMGDAYDEKALAALVRHISPSIINGQLGILRSLQGLLGTAYAMESGYVLKWEGAGAIEEDACGDVERAGEEDCREIAELVAGEESIGGYYEIEDLTRQLVQRQREGMGRNYIVRKDGKIVSHCATYGEFDEIAVVAGIITHPAYRRQGLSRRIFLCLLRDLVWEGKEVYLFTYGDSLRRMYERLGMAVAGEWGKLVKERP